MVAIDGPEDILAEQVIQGPRIFRSRSGSCRNCGQPGSETVHLVVTVGKNGRVRWIRSPREWDHSGNPRILAAAEEALREWSFQPAVTDKGLPADGWAEVDVPVEITAQ